MTFRYFAYGSNMWPPQLCSRCGSARSVGRVTARGWRVLYDKPGADGTAKANLREAPGEEVEGVLYEIDDSDRPELDGAEPGYTPFEIDVSLDSGELVGALTYRWRPGGTDALPLDWYVGLVTAGAELHGLSESHVATLSGAESRSEPDLSGLAPAGTADLPAMQAIVASAISPGADRYTIHPGDLAWWVWHADPRYPHHNSYWLIPGEILLVIDSRYNEVNVVSAPGLSRIPAIEWARRRLGENGEVAAVADSDVEMIDYLEGHAYEPVRVSRWYRRDLTHVDLPEPVVGDGWMLRPLAGEHEADERRRASHAAFGSSMDPDLHLERYLRFMRSPVYDLSRDLIAVSPEGRIASFMVWWPDASGIAQVEPFGTHPDYQRMGLGRALMHFGLKRMQAAGMNLARVITEEHREAATAFYESVGFEDVGRLRWWRRSPHQATGK